MSTIETTSGSFVANVNLLVQNLADILSLNVKLPQETVDILLKLSQYNLDQISENISNGNLELLSENIDALKSIALNLDTLLKLDSTTKELVEKAQKLLEEVQKFVLDSQESMTETLTLAKQEMSELKEELVSDIDSEYKDRLNIIKSEGDSRIAEIQRLANETVSLLQQYKEEGNLNYQKALLLKIDIDSKFEEAKLFYENISSLYIEFKDKLILANETLNLLKTLYVAEVIVAPAGTDPCVSYDAELNAFRFVLPKSYDATGSGVSPTIVVKVNTEDEYILTITDVNGSFDTPNLKCSCSGGGTTPEGPETPEEPEVPEVTFGGYSVSNGTLYAPSDTGFSSLNYDNGGLTINDADSNFDLWIEDGNLYIKKQV